jgi:hypothetical protein
MLLHLLRADTRRFRWAILGWLLLEVLNSALQVLLPSLAENQAVSPATTLL